MAVLYPQLQRFHARARMQEVISGDQQPVWKAAHADQTFSPLGGHPAESAQLSALRQSVLESVPWLDIRTKATNAAKSQFDSAVAATLLRVMDVTPYEAAQEGVWQFLCSTLMPDLVIWRFADDGGMPNAERYTGLTRNTFGRLWWRAYVLAGPKHEDPAGLLALMTEDECVQIMERPTIAGNRLLARTLALGFMKVVKDQEHAGRTLRDMPGWRQTLMRAVTKRILRSAAVICVDALGSAELEAFTLLELDRAVAALLLQDAGQQHGAGPQAALAGAA